MPAFPGMVSPHISPLISNLNMALLHAGQANFIAEKNLSHNEGVEFGYSFGVSRPLGTIASAANCHLCRENFIAGAELFGGLGSTKGFGFHDTTHYFAPALSWQVSNNSSLRF